MEPQDVLVQRIADYVATQVPPGQRDIVTRTVCMAIATLMNDPSFTSELLVVRQLREENAYIKNQYLILKQMMDRVGVKAPRKRAPAKKKAAATPRVKGGTAAQRQAFQAGYNDLRYPRGS